MHGIRYNRRMRPFACFALVLILLLLAGCPPADKRDDSNRSSSEPDEFDTYVRLIDNLTGAQDELKRLQRISTASSQGTGQAVQPPYSISVETGDSGVEIRLAGTIPEDTWHLSAWRAPMGQEAFTVINDEPGPAGHSFEAHIGDALTLNLQMLWLPDGGIQVRRSLLLGGLDHTYEIPEDACDWVLSGPWQPYRLQPQPAGPWGIASNADGEWHSAAYPGSCGLPAVAAYGTHHGWLLAIADEHARKLDRRYALAWRIVPDYSAGEQLRLRTSYYNSTTGGYYPGLLVSGAEHRDAIVLKRLSFGKISEDLTSVEVQSTQVVEALADFVHEQHYTPQHPPSPLAGNVVRLTDWLVDGEPAEQVRELDRLSALAGVRYALISAEEQASGVITPELAATLDALLITVVVEPPANAAASALVEPRDPVQAAAWLRRLLDRTAAPEESAASAEDSLEGIPAQLHFIHECWDLAAGLDSADSEPGLPEGRATGYPMCKALSKSVLMLHAAEQARLAEPEMLLLAKGDPALCLPAFADGYIAAKINNPEASEFNPLAARLSNRLAADAFGANVIAVSPDGTPAGLVLAAGGYQAGLLLERGMTKYDGFEALSLHTEGFKWRDQEIGYIYTNPIASTYSLEGERPADCIALVAVVPGQFDKAEAVWVVFAGIGGSVTVDYRNNLYITWNEDGVEQAWTDRLPVGFWRVDHPAPMEVEPGDAVLVRKDALRPDTQPGAGVGL